MRGEKQSLLTTSKMRLKYNYFLNHCSLCVRREGSVCGRAACRGVRSLMANGRKKQKIFKKNKSVEGQRRTQRLFGEGAVSAAPDKAIFIVGMNNNGHS